MSTPTIPKTDSLAARSLMRLLIGQKFTHKDFLRETGSYRLSGYVESLSNRHNWPIESLLEWGQTSDPTGRRTIYARYSIAGNVLIVLRKEMGTERVISLSQRLSVLNRGRCNELL